MESTAVATTVKSAGKRLASLVQEVNSGTVAVEIAGKSDSAVLISLAHYTALQEATFLLRSPELMASLRREMARSLLPAPEQSAAPDTAKSPDKCRRGSKAKARKKRSKRKKKKSA